MPQDAQIQGLALGKFDGMHLAHRALITHLPPQSTLLCIESKGETLTPNKALYSPYPVISVCFEEIMGWSGAYFMEIINDKFPSLVQLVVGYDFAFGKNRAYGVNELIEFFGKKVLVMPEFRVNGVSVHSSLIKASIRAGDMQKAAKMLGRFYYIEGGSIPGQNLGSKVLYATINIRAQDYVLPQNGVYATFTQLGEELLPSVSFIGNRLSTDNAFSIETHILEREIHILPNDRAGIFFVQKIRDNQQFLNLQCLKEAITQDVQEAGEILHNADKNLAL